VCLEDGRCIGLPLRILRTLTGETSGRIPEQLTVPVIIPILSKFEKCKNNDFQVSEGAELNVWLQYA
jgi:hypothetical protein